jgi:polysaccharide export outer membrane protein
MGEVKTPGVYQVLGSRTLLDVISMAGGLTNAADTRVTVKRRTGENQNVTVKLKNDDVQTSIANDVQIYPGDLVLVARAGIVYVMGDVNRPGGFVMQDNGHISLLQALAQAGGATNNAAPNGALLLRKSGDAYVSRKVEVGKITHGQGEDMQLRPNDILYIPNSRMKNALRTAQGLATSIGSATIYAVVQ